MAFALLFSKSTVIGVEHVKELANTSIKNIRKKHSYLLNNGRVKIYVGDGRKGKKNEAPFDYIHSGASKILIKINYHLFIN